MSQIAIIDASTSGAGLWPAYEAAKQHSVILITSDRRRYRHSQCTEILDDIQVIDGVDTRSLDEVAKALDGYPIDGVISQYDRSLRTAARFASAAGLPFADADVIELCQNKAAFRKLCARSRIASPTHAEVSDLQAAISFGADFGYPVVLKPSRGTGSRGVFIAFSEVELRRFYADCAEASFEFGGVPLIEEYLVGPVVSVELLVDRDRLVVLGFTDRILTSPPYCGELAETFPVSLSDANTAGLLDLTANLVSATRFDLGFAHIEFALTASGPVVIEFNPRIGGSFIGPMIAASLNWNPYTAMVSMAIGDRASIPRIDKRKIAVPVGAASEASIYASQAGVLQSLAGVDLAKRIPGIEAVVLFAEVGMQVATASNQLNEAGILWARGATPSEAAGRARAAAGLVVLDTGD